MKNNKTHLQGIDWHEGMLLMPHHFQQNDYRYDSLLHYHVNNSSCFHWGTVRFEYDKPAILNGIVRILRLEAIMPDGLEIFYHYKNAENELKIDLNELDEDIRDGEKTLYVAVLSRGASIDSPGADIRRYISAEGEGVFDQTTGKNEIIIPRLIPKIYLFIGETPSKKYHYFPLMKIRLIDDNFIVADYVPPMLKVKAGMELAEITREVVHKLKEKSLAMAEKLRNSTGIVNLSQIVELKMIIYSLTSEVPLLETLLNSDESHPFQLYLILCSILGKLSILSPGLVPPQLPPYNHNEPLAHFNSVREYIFRFVEEGVSEAYSSLQFSYQNGVFYIKILEEWLSKKLIVGVRRGNDKTLTDTIKWLEDCVIGSESKVKAITEKRILGAERKLIESRGDLPAFANVAYFSLEPDPEFVCGGEKLKIFNVTAKEKEDLPSEILLLIKKVQ